jgi:succinate dehydrogenase hydrophobic anchor subunit
MMQPASPSVGGADRTVSWRLIRVTALFLAVLLPLHVVIVVLRDDIGRTTFVTVTDRLTGPWWPGLEWVTLVLALAHGFLVLRARLVPAPGAGTGREVAVVALGVTAVLLALGATWAMLTFS